MDFQYATGTFKPATKPAIDKSSEKPKVESVTWYNGDTYYFKDEQGTVWVSRDGETWEVQK